MLEEGARLPRPDICPASAYTELMLPCWAADPAQRPTFAELAVAVRKVELQVT